MITLRPLPLPSFALCDLDKKTIIKKLFNPIICLQLLPKNKQLIWHLSLLLYIFHYYFKYFSVRSMCKIYLNILRPFRVLFIPWRKGLKRCWCCSHCSPLHARVNVLTLLPTKSNSAIQVSAGITHNLRG